MFVFFNSNGVPVWTALLMSLLRISKMSFFEMIPSFFAVLLACDTSDIECSILATSRSFFFGVSKSHFIQIILWIDVYISIT